MPPHNIANDLEDIYQADRKLLEKTALPIITVSANYAEDLKGLHRRPELDKGTDIVLSRAHYSMALGVAVAAWGDKIDPKKAWLVDSTNYVSQNDLKSVRLTHAIGKTIARFSILKSLKDLVDRFGRSKMPILDNVTPPTLYLGAGLNKPILSMHIVTGNILANEGKKVLQMITDPHVRGDYLLNANLPNLRFLVFDEATKTEFFEVAKKIGKKIPASQLADKVVVTGPPIDPRIVACHLDKAIYDNDRPLRICITTGGLGTNKEEIKKILKQLLPVIKAQTLGQINSLPPVELMFYAGTHADHLRMAQELAAENQLAIQTINPKDPANFKIGGKLNQDSSIDKQDRRRFFVLYHPQIVDANELLIQHAFPWADLFISKPSGDMAYDAAASGAALLTLKEWGDWEHNVRATFESLEVSQVAETENIVEQLAKLSFSQDNGIKSKAPISGQRPVPQLKEQKQEAWISKAMSKAQNLPKKYYQGAENILKEYYKIES
jgi:hypothetical protein